MTKKLKQKSPEKFSGLFCFNFSTFNSYASPLAG
ncbi:hypothetical protein GFO_1797 [Christiangramia forsetii KT0803]|uniref:Uncharacterized protein n=1 Tax=Christiangramia forsetii (strain DSM 17595 / CGMCC 1.15422 / KT0803) TaxID=411154 RepID=A0M2C2_CHRFK|nr:hypothetical protein GFO_1797 [Christiangramia forsetii KT0803]